MAIKIRVDGEVVGRYQRTRNRIIFEEGVYHVIQRAPGEEVLFRESQDYQCFKFLMKRTVEKFGISIICYSLLPNHVHLLLQIHEKNLSVAMKHLFGSYALTFNKRYKRKGHVFYGPFRAMVCDSDHYLLAATIYIHLNAFKSGLCKSILKYRWHSLDRYLCESERDYLTQSNFVLSKINEDRTQACQEYEKMLQAAVGRPLKLGKTVLDIPKAVSACLAGAQSMSDRPALIKNAYGVISKRAKKELALLGRVAELQNSGYASDEIAEELCVSRSTYFRAVRRLKAANLLRSGTKPADLEQVTTQHRNDRVG